MAERQKTKLVPLSRGVPQWCFRQTLEKEMVSFKRSTVELAMIHRAFKVFWSCAHRRWTRGLGTVDLPGNQGVDSC